MYENPGKKLKSVVEVFRTISIVLCIGIGVVIVVASEGENLLGGLLVAAIGSFVSWISGLTLATFADIADNLYNIRANIAVLCGEKVPEAGESKEREPGQSATAAFCPKCSAMQSRGRTTCDICGASLIIE